MGNLPSGVSGYAQFPLHDSITDFEDELNELPDNQDPRSAANWWWLGAR